MSLFFCSHGYPAFTNKIRMCAVETTTLCTCLSSAGLKMRVKTVLGHCLFSDLSFSETHFFHRQVKRYFSQLFTPKAILHLQVKHSDTRGSFCSQLHLLNSIIFRSALITYRQTHSLDLVDPAIRTLINSCDHDSWPRTERKSLYHS